MAWHLRFACASSTPAASTTPFAHKITNKHGAFAGKPPLIYRARSGENWRELACTGNRFWDALWFRFLKEFGMNVTHRHDVFEATEVNGEVVLKELIGAVCAQCGSEGPAANTILHKSDCPEAKKTAAA